MIDEFLDEDIEANSALISDIYELSKKLKQNMEPSKENDMEMYNILALTGVLDNTLKKMNTYFKKVMEEDLGEPENPFVIESGASTFIQKQYEQMKSDEEITVNGIMLANRLAKLANAFTKINTDDSGEKNVSMLGWDENKLEFMSRMFSKYQEDYSKNNWNFASDIEFDDDGNINNERFQFIRNDSKVEINNDEYENFKKWYRESWEELIKKGKEEGLSINNSSVEGKDIPDFQKYMRMRLSENVFYEEKYLGIKRAAELRDNKEVKLFDVTEYDTKDYDGKKVIRIDLAGYVAPFLVHCDEAEFNATFGEKLDDILIKNQTSKYRYYPHWNYRMTEKQLEFAKHNIPNNITFGDNMSKDVLQYIKSSAEHKDFVEDYKKKLEIREKNRRIREEEKVREQDKKGVEMEQKMEVNEKTDENNKKIRHTLKDDQDFINENIIKVLEENSVIQLPDDYKEKLRYKKESIGTKFERVYNTIEEFLEPKLQGESEDKLKLESTKMFTYMKLAERSFWSGVNGKTGKGKSQTREELYEKIYADMDKGIEVLNEAIVDKVLPSELKMYARKKFKTEEIKGVDKTHKRMTGEKGALDKKPKIKLQPEELIQVSDGIKPTEEATKETNKEQAENINVKKDGNNTLAEEIKKQNSLNEKVSGILKRKEEKIQLQQELLRSKEEYLTLLEELKKKQDIIRENEEKIAEKDNAIESIENKIFGDRGEK